MRRNATTGRSVHAARLCLSVFHRAVDSLRNAIESASAEIESAGYQVARVEACDQSIFDEINSKLT